MARLSNDTDAKSEIINALIESGERAELYDIVGIFREAYAWKIDKNADGQELLDTAGFEMTVSDEEFWSIVHRHYGRSAGESGMSLS